MSWLSQGHFTTAGTWTHFADDSTRLAGTPAEARGWCPLEVFAADARPLVACVHAGAASPEGLPVTTTVRSAITGTAAHLGDAGARCVVGASLTFTGPAGARGRREAGPTVWDAGVGRSLWRRRCGVIGGFGLGGGRIPFGLGSSGLVFCRRRRCGLRGGRGRGRCFDNRRRHGILRGLCVGGAAGDEEDGEQDSVHRGSFARGTPYRSMAPLRGGRSCWGVRVGLTVGPLSATDP